MQKLQLYYHFPFCLSKCAYCAFFSKPCVSAETIEAYISALIRQTRSFEAEGYEVSSIYFGGGTPSIAGAKHINDLLNAIYLKFKLCADVEITLEANPKTIDLEGLQHLKAGGINRLSLGAQSFNNQTLKTLNRAHTAEDFVFCFNSARQAGFNNINADLIFALPNEKTEMLLYSVRSLADLQPEHISVYGLSIEEGTPLWAKKESLFFPDEEEEERQYDLLCNELSTAGYEHYEISNFAKHGFRSTHNTGYWKRTPYFGFGAGAHSFFENRRFYTKEDISTYIENSKNGFKAPTNFASSTIIDEKEAEEERIMLGLRLADGVSISKNVPKHLIKNGLVKIEHGNLCITEKGFRVSNAIIAEFI